MWGTKQAAQEGREEEKSLMSKESTAERDKHISKVVSMK